QWTLAPLREEQDEEDRDWWFRKLDPRSVDGLRNLLDSLQLIGGCWDTKAHPI
ncbi:hypothetical protein TcasGA2_TC034958, partial [Tribolium castaneum]